MNQSPTQRLPSEPPTESPGPASTASPASSSPSTESPQTDDYQEGAKPASGLPLPHERDASTGHVASQPDPIIEQAKKDLDAGQVDTDMWGTPGLDNARKDRLVPNTKPEP